MTIRDTLRVASSRLESAGVPNAAHDAAQLLAHALGESDALRMRLFGEREVPQTVQSVFDALLVRRQAREPLQYILGTADFMGLRFRVAPDVLIPRADTEILCEAALQRLAQGARVLDIGTGSGALAVSIACLAPTCSVTAVDISDAALTIARENAQRLGAPVRFVKSDCFDALTGETFEMILSNPPYITGEEMHALMPEVRREPELALFGGTDGLCFYRRIAKEAGTHLRTGGFLLFEIGWQQKDAVCALLEQEIGSPFALKDYGDHWRVVGAQKRIECGRTL